MSVTCINGHENLDGMTFCEDCGVELTSVTNTPPPTAPGVEAIAPRVADTAVHVVGESTPVVSQAAESPQPAPIAPDPTPILAPAPEGSPAVAEILPIQTLVPESTLPGESAAPSPAPAGPAATGGAYLEITQGEFAGRRLPVGEPVCLIGRWDIDSASFPQIDLSEVDTDAKISRKHARITKDGDRYLIEDLGSLNGTSHQGSARLVPGDQRQLNDGDTVIMGRLFMRFGTS